MKNKNKVLPLILAGHVHKRLKDAATKANVPLYVFIVNAALSCAESVEKWAKEKEK